MKNRLIHAAILALFALFQPLIAADAELRGVVTDSVTGAPLNGAAVVLTPGGGGGTLTTESDILGRYEFLAVPAGAYTLDSTLGGYLPFVEGVAYAADEIASKNIPMVKAPGSGTRIDLQLKVTDTKTNRPLKDVPVRIQRFANDTASTALATIIGKTDDRGMMDLKSQPTGWYEFRYNFAADGVALKWYKSYAPPRRDELVRHHAVVGKLLLVAQSVKVTVTGPDPVDLDAGPVALGGVTVELVGVEPGFAPPPGFDPMTENLEDHADPIVQRITGLTDGTGSFTFPNLPPNDYICTAKKLGYVQSQGIIAAAADGTLPAIHAQMIGLDHDTSVSVIVENDQYADKMLLEGLAIVLEGLPGTATDGIMRLMPATLMPPPGPGMPPLAVADFMDVLPGRYRAWVDARTVSPPTPAAEDAVTTIGIHWKGESIFGVAQGKPNATVISLEVVPAKIRGRFFKAETRSKVKPPNLGGLPHPLDRWLGPAYDMAAADGIEFTQSELAPYLDPAMKAVSVSTDEFGNFEMSVLPSFYGVIVPTLDGYWGSNYRSENQTTGEVFNLGWPYPVDPALTGGIPAHPFGSKGIPINSGDILEIDLYVRKQAYFLDGTIFADTDCPLLDMIVAGDAATDTWLGVDVSHVAATGVAKYDKDADGGDVDVELKQGKVVLPGGSCVGNINATFLVEDVPPGTHKVSVSTPQYAQVAGLFDIMTLPDYGFPGSGDSGTGGDVVPMENNWDQVGGLIDPHMSDYKGDHHLAMEFVGKDAMGMEVVRFTKFNPHFAKHGGTRLFRVGTTPMFEMYEGPWEVWYKDAGHWFHHTFTIPMGSPPTTETVRFKLPSEWGAAAPPTSPPASPAYEIQFKAVNDADPKVTVKEVTATFTGAMDGPDLVLSTATGGMTLKTDWTGGFTPAIGGAALAKWTVKGTDRDLIIPPGFGAKPRVVITTRLERGAAVWGKVLAKAIYKDELMVPMESTADFAGIKVRLYDRHGNGPVREFITDGEGKFSTGLMPLPSVSALYLDIDVPGYKTLRTRFDANDGAEGGGAPLDFNLEMPPVHVEMIPQPKMYPFKVVFDRIGPYLRGVRKGAGAFAPDDDLKMTYTFEADSAEKWSQAKVSFDTASGSAGGSPSKDVVDKVTSFWLVNSRYFPGPMISHARALYELPSQFIEGSDFIPNPLFNWEMAEKLQVLTRTPLPNHMVLHRAGPLQADIGGGMGSKATKTGTLQLPDLPPGRFEPYLIAETSRGAFQYFKISPSPTTPQSHVLYGMELPPWLAKMADVMETMNAVKTGASGVVLKTILPSGMLQFLPEVSGDITLNPKPDPSRAEQTLKYTYFLGSEYAMGGSVSPYDWLGFTTFAGLDVGGKVSVEVDGASISKPGKAGAPEIHVKGDAKLGAIAPGVEIAKGSGFQKFRPALLSKAVKKSAEEALPFQFQVVPRVNAKLESTSRENVPGRANDPLGDLEKHLFYELNGLITVKNKVDLVVVLNGVAPPLGTALYAKAKSVGAKCWFLCEPSIGAGLTRDITTRYRQAIPAGATPGLNPRRVHALGEEILTYQQVNKSSERLYLGMKTGVEVEVLGGRLGGTGTISVKGNKPPKGTGLANNLSDALVVHLNFFGEGPWWTLVEGEVRAEVSLFADAWVVRGTLKLVDIGVPIKLRPNTEEIFLLIPYDQENSVISPATSVATEWVSAHPHLVGNYFPLAQYAVSSDAAGTGALAYMDITPSGEMKLRLALRSTPTTWGPPADIATAPGILGVAVHALSGGGWMVAWSEISASELGKDAPASTVVAATSADGITWSAPTTVANIPGTAYDLRLLPMATGDLGLVWVESERGVGTTVVDIEAAHFESSTSTWGAAATLYDDLTIFGWDAAGPGFAGTVPAQIMAFTDGGAGLVAVDWDGTSLGAPVGIDGSTTGPSFSVTAGPADTFTAVYQLSGGGIAAARKVGAGPWSILPPLPGLDGLSVNSLDLVPVDDGFATHYMLGYTQGGTESPLGFAYLDAAGALSAPPIEVPNDFGDYRSAQLIPTAGAHAGNIFAIFDNGGVNELRTFATSELSGFTATDRDGDSLDDFEELRIVDADPLDLIKKIDDVLGGDDFDGDGHTNAAEIAAGTDPTDPDSFPGQVVSVEKGETDPMEFTSVTGTFILSRTGDLTIPLEVGYALGGTATSSIDYLDPTGIGTASFALGQDTVVVNIVPLADTEVEGSETVTLTILPDAAYSIGTGSPATLTIKDLPLDEWRFAKFSAGELADPGVSGLGADGEGDGLDTLLEYAFDSEPKLVSLEDAPVSVALIHPLTGKTHFAVVSLRRKDAKNLSYDYQLSTELEVWTAASAGDVEEISAVDNGDGTETVTVRLTAPVPDTGVSRQFLRLVITRISG